MLFNECEASLAGASSRSDADNSSIWIPLVRTDRACEFTASGDNRKQKRAYPTSQLGSRS